MLNCNRKGAGTELLVNRESVSRQCFPEAWPMTLYYLHVTVSISSWNNSLRPDTRQNIDICRNATVKIFGWCMLMISDQRLQGLSFCTSSHIILMIGGMTGDDRSYISSASSIYIGRQR